MQELPTFVLLFKASGKVRLDSLERRLQRRIDLAESRLANFLQRNAMPLKAGSDLHELEGWLSEVWQTWGRFCRRTVIESCIGCVGSNGALVAAMHASDEHVSYVASKQKRGIAPNVVGVNQTLRLEPTWGHIDKLLEVIQALNPNNHARLSAAFGTVPEIEHIRLIRNCAAHINHQTFAAVIAFQPQYLASPIKHPLEALFWTVPATGKTLIHARLDEMRICARNACV